ncbi:MAG TPA: hypothetical protein VD947_00765 [Patescibacteria group bacterium]|nr:hypothetical protein [Patescibacteria group bacterium]
MAGEMREVPLNIEAFQLSIIHDKPQITRGIPIGIGTDGSIYVDPQQEHHHPDNLGHAAPDNLTLKINEEPSELPGSPSISGGKFYDASLGVEKLSGGYALPSGTGPRYEPKKNIIISRFSPIAIGRSALMGIVEREGHVVSDIRFDGESETTLMQRFTFQTSHRQYVVSAFLLGQTGEIDITHHPGDFSKSATTYTLTYDQETGVVINGFENGDTDDDKGGQDDGPEPDDREPRTPIDPAGSIAAAVELPTEDKPLELLGKRLQ